MWLWQLSLQQPSIKYRKTIFLTKLGFVITLVHILFLFCVLFAYKGDMFSQHVDLKQGGAVVMFFPFQKKLYKAGNVAGGTTTTTGIKVVRIGARTSTEKKDSKNQSSKKVERPATKLIEESTVRKRGRLRKEKKSKKLKKEAKQREKKLDTQPAQTATKKDEPSLKQIVQKQEEAVPENPNAQEVGTNELIHAGQADMDALEVAQAIRSTIESTWSPPAGVAEGKGCKVRVLVGWDGKAKEIVFEESSNVVAFDISVRCALISMEFPKNTYGKELILPFKQQEHIHE